MTTAARPTCTPAKEGQEQSGTRIFVPSQKYSSQDMASHTTLMPRKEGQDTQDEVQRRNLRDEREDRERRHFSSKDKFSDMKRRISPRSSQSASKRSRRSNSTRGEWSSLPDDILVTIAELLISPDGINFACFRAVCRSCRAAAAKVDFTLVRQMPWVVLPTTIPSRERQIFNPSENKLYKLLLPEACWATACGSVKGWVATVSDDFCIQLFNLSPFLGHPRKLSPFMGHPQKISLPSFVGLTPSRRLPQYNNIVIKVCLPSSPIEDPKGIVVAIYSSEARLAFMRLGSRAWTPINSPAPTSFCDVVSCKGRFYAANITGDVFKLDLRRRQTVKIASRSMTNSALCYLTESAGHLLQVVECYDSGLPRVFKLDFGSGGWEAVRSLGECSLFIGMKNCTTSVHAPDLFGCRPNCIYYFDDVILFSVRAMVVFSLDDDKIIERHDMGQTDVRCEITPLWFSPFIWWQKGLNAQQSLCSA